ncbi:MAG TPA: hypothetical protein VFV02_08360 [Acidimicrobiales bacterium]|nr:hypothetical protein [Acidimicrobiales bacterium]
MKRLAAVYGGSAHHLRALHEPKYARWLAGTVYLPDLPNADLSTLDGLIVPERIHRGMLHRARRKLLEFLDEGKTLILFGEQSVYGDQPIGWLPGIDWEHCPTNYWWWLEPGARSGLVAGHPDHSFWARLTLRDVTWHHHGTFRPPQGTQSLVSTEEGRSILYVDRVSSPGAMVVAALDPMSHYGSYFMPATERFLDGFLPWAVEDLLNERLSTP